MELKKAREAEEKEKVLAEEKKLERRIQEQQDRMRMEFEEEQAKKKAKEDAVISIEIITSRKLGVLKQGPSMCRAKRYVSTFTGSVFNSL